MTPASLGFLSPKLAKSDAQRLGHGLRVILYFIYSRLVFWRMGHLSKQMPKRMKQNKADEDWDMGSAFLHNILQYAS